MNITQDIELTTDTTWDYLLLADDAHVYLAGRRLVILNGDIPIERIHNGTRADHLTALELANQE